MVILAPTLQENQEAQKKAERYKFYVEILSEIKDIFKRNDSIAKQNISSCLNDESFFKKLSTSIEGESYQDEEALFIHDGKFYIYGDEFTEEEIIKIVQSYIEDDDIDGFIKLATGLGSNNEEEDGFDFRVMLSNFPGNIIGAILEKIRNTSFCRKIRDDIDRLLRM